MSSTDDIGVRISRLLREAAPDDVPDAVLRATFDRTRVLDQQRPALAIRVRTSTTRSTFAGPGGLAMAAAIAVLLFAAIGILMRPGLTSQVGSQGPATPSTSPSSSPSRSSNSALDRVRATGRLRVGVAQPVAGLPSGGDRYLRSIALELGTRLGVTVDLVPMAQDELLADTTGGPWDIAFPTAALPHGDPRHIATAPYADVPRYLVVSLDHSPAAGFDGRTVCVVAGSSGAAWLANSIDFLSPSTVVAPPANAKVLTFPTDSACLEAVRSGRADAAITRDLLKSEIVAQPGLVIQGGVLYHDPLVVVVAHSLPTLDGRLLLTEVESGLEDLRSAGKLRDLSVGAFDGADLSVPSN